MGPFGSFNQLFDKLAVLVFLKFCLLIFDCFYTVLAMSKHNKNTYSQILETEKCDFLDLGTISTIEVFFMHSGRREISILKFLVYSLLSTE